MSANTATYQPLGLAFIPKAAMNRVLHYLVKQWIAELRCGFIRKRDRHPSYVYSCYKSFQMKNRMIIISPKGKALSLLKSQFAKKPKNPV